MQERTMSGSRGTTAVILMVVSSAACVSNVLILGKDRYVWPPDVASVKTCQEIKNKYCTLQFSTSSLSLCVCVILACTWVC